MSDLPPGWVTTTLGEATASTRPICYGVLKPGPFDPDGVPLLRIQDLAGNRIAEDGIHFISAELDDEYARSKLAGGEVLLSIQGTVGRVAIVPPRLSGANISRTLAVIAPDERLDRPFLRYYFEHLAYRHAYETGGTTRASLNISTIRKMSVPVPPLNEQRRIVAAIEEHLSRLDAADASLAAALRRLQAFRNGVLDEAIDGHPETSLGEFSRIFVGATPSRRKPELWGGGVPWVSSGEVQFGRITRTRETITPDAVTSSDRLHPPGTVLLGMIGEGKTRGQAAILEVEATHNQNSAAIRLDQSVCTPGWLFYVFMARYEETRRAGSGAQQAALNRARVAALPIPLPSLEEQRRIVQEVEERTTRIDAMRASIERAQRRSKALRAAILERAFSGELVPQDLSDEPAETLLARIRWEREHGLA